MIFQHGRYQIWNKSQHPYQHSGSDIAHASAALPGVTNITQAIDWLTKVLYPNTETQVATPANLPLVGNTLNDYRVVLDDGDGKQAGYRWEQREGDVAASWYKIYDFDWSTDSILSAFLDITQDEYLHKQGRDDADSAGVALAGDLAGQHTYGGVTANTHFTIHANSGDGVGAQTGFVQVTDNFRPFPGSNVDLGTAASRWGTMYSANGVIGTMAVTGGSITDSSGAISFGNENLSTSGTLTVGPILLSGASITSTTGTITFGNENLTTTGTVTANNVQAVGSASAFFTGTTVGNLTLANGSITDSSGTISFGDENLITTGTLGAGFSTFTRLDVDNVRIDGNAISVTALNGNLSIAANGTGFISVANAMLTQLISASGNISTSTFLSSPDALLGDIRIKNNTISAQPANTDINLAPTGTGMLVTWKSFKPVSDNVYTLGISTRRYLDMFLSNSIQDGTNTMLISTLMSLRNVTTGANDGDSLFWDNATSRWLASNPDTEIDHGELSGLGDDDHTQYVFVTGRTGGQSIIGGIDASDNLTLESTSNVSKGSILFVSNLSPSADNSVDIGGVSLRVRNLYVAGQAIGLRLENAANVAGLPGASASTPGRMAWAVAEKNVYVDNGGVWQKINSEKFVLQDTTGWDGIVSQVVYTVSGDIDDARFSIWALYDNADSFKRVDAEFSKTATQVTVDTEAPLPVGTYTLVGIG